MALASEPSGVPENSQLFRPIQGADIKREQQPGHLFCVDIQHLQFIFRPLEIIFLQSFVPDAKAISVPELYLDATSCHSSFKQKTS
jgi:hypothetical protein